MQVPSEPAHPPLSKNQIHDVVDDEQGPGGPDHCIEYLSPSARQVPNHFYRIGDEEYQCSKKKGPLGVLTPDHLSHGDMLAVAGLLHQAWLAREVCAELARFDRGLRYGAHVDDDLEELGDPRCARCLVTLEVAGTVERPFWRCPSCGLLALT